jgi:peptide/nickel transport system substrate-binding protein
MGCRTIRASINAAEWLSALGLVLAGRPQARGSDWTGIDMVRSYAIAMHGDPALPADFDHLPYADPQAPKGGRVAPVDEVQYQRRRQHFDFDMMIGSWIASASPGNEQRARWGSASADQEASFNLAGVKFPAVDALISAMLAAESHEDFIAAVRAYDRALLSGFYIVPLFHASDEWIAYSSKLGRPAALPRFAAPLLGATLETWWRKRP